MRLVATTLSKILLGLVATIAATTLARGGTADTADRVDWATGTVFLKKLAEPVNLLWAEFPLRQAIGSLSHARKVAILIDRRVDPNQKLNISLNGVPLESALRTIAERQGLSFARLGTIVYLGPPSAADHLRATMATLERDIRQSTPATKRKYRQLRKLSWEDLATPRDLLAQLGEESKLKISGLDLVPHDLWAAADLPAMPLVDRLALIAVQFDLAFKVGNQGESLELVPQSVEVKRQPETTRAKSKRTPVATKTPPSVEWTRIDRISIQEKPLGAVLEQLAIRLNLELKMDRAAIQTAGISIDQRVSVRLENTTIDELLRQLLKPTRLTFERHERVVEIVPAK